MASSEALNLFKSIDLVARPLTRCDRVEVDDQIELAQTRLLFQKRQSGLPQAFLLDGGDGLESLFVAAALLDLDQMQARALLRQDIDFALGHFEAKAEDAIAFQHQVDEGNIFGQMAAFVCFRS